MSEPDNTQTMPTAIGELLMSLFGWIILGMALALNPAAGFADAGLEFQSQITSVLAGALYPVAALVLVFSILALKKSALGFGLFGGAFHITCSIISAASALGIVALGLLRMCGVV